MLDNADSRAKQEQQLNQALWQSIEHSFWVATAIKPAQLSQLTAQNPATAVASNTYATCTKTMIAITACLTCTRATNRCYTLRSLQD